MDEGKRALSFPESTRQKRSLGPVHFDDVRSKLPGKSKAVDEEADDRTPIARPSQPGEEIELFRGDELDQVTSFPEPLSEAANDVTGAL